MAIDEASVQDWLDRYILAWRGNDEAAIAALFSEDVAYAYHPWEPPLRGRDEVVRSWLEEPDTPDSWDAEYRPVAIADDVAVASGVSRYHATPDQPAREYHNIFVIRFDSQGRCREFREWYVKRPAEEPAVVGG